MCPILCTGRLKALADIVLIVIMVGGAYTHYALHDPPEKMIPAVVAGSLLIIRHLLDFRTQQRSKAPPQARKLD